MKRMLTRRGVMAGTAAIAAAPLTSPLSASTPSVHEVDIRSFNFVPTVLQVRIGDTIRWINRDLAPHTATADEFGWDTGALERTEVGEVIVEKDMETTYFCVFHPHMKGQIEIIA